MLELLRTRRSIRKFQAKKIPPETINDLQEAILRAPTSRNNQCWTFVFVDDPDLLEKLSRARPHGSSFLKNAPLAVIISGDETISDVWVEDCAIAATFLHLTAHSLGLGSCWIQVRNRPHNNSLSAEEYIRQLVALPDHLRVLCMMGIGFAAEEKPGWPKETLKYDKIFLNRFGEVYPHHNL